MRKIRRAGKYFYRILSVVFWAGLVFMAGYGWYYAEHQIPEHFSVSEGEETSFSLDLPLYTTLLSESEEVILKGDSGIPQEEIRIRPDQEFSLYARKGGNFRLGLKLFGTIPFKEIRRFRIPETPDQLFGFLFGRTEDLSFSGD